MNEVLRRRFERLIQEENSPGAGLPGTDALATASGTELVETTNPSPRRHNLALYPPWERKKNRGGFPTVPIWSWWMEHCPRFMLLGRRWMR